MHKYFTSGLFVSLAMLLPLSVSAAEFRAGQEASLNSGETIQGNLYLGGGNVTDTGAVKGDLVIGGGTILVNGPVGQDLLIGGGTITVTSDVGGDLRIGGGNITVQGKIAGDAVIGGGQIILAGTQVGGDAVIGGGNITIDAPVNGSLKAGGGQVTINAPIKGDVYVQANKLFLGPKAVINGNLSYTSPAQATIESGALVHGKTDYIKSVTSTSSAAPQAAVGAFLTFWLFAKLLMTLLGVFVFFWIFPRYAQDLVRIAYTKPLESLGKGFVTLIVLPIASIILLMTIIGIPLGALGLFGFVALMVFSSMIAPVVIGSIVHKWIWRPAEFLVDWKTILLGVAIYFMLGFIPLVGGLIKFVVILMTLGVVVGVKWDLANKNLR
jgi:cytoskeletal protein CcmA (bactofilin family)